jgi:predicted nucleotidyltransferase
MLEITETEEKLAQRRHAEIRDHVRSRWQLSEDFLTGSYRRQTKTKKLKDVDIFVVLDPAGPQAGLREQNPAQILATLQQVLRERYEQVTIDGFACVVAFGSDSEVASFEVVPAFKRSGGGWEIPDARRSAWIATNPKLHHEQSTKMNQACDERFVPFVKMIKGINREAGEPIKPAFLLEVMAHGLVRAPFGRYQDEIRWFLASAAAQVQDDWPDPAGIGPDVNSTVSASERTRYRAVLEQWLGVAEEAVLLEDDGQERAAVEKWRELFGSRMPRP